MEGDDKEKTLAAGWKERGTKYCNTVCSLWDGRGVWLRKSSARSSARMRRGAAAKLTLKSFEVFQLAGGSLVPGRGSSGRRGGPEQDGHERCRHGRTHSRVEEE